MSKILIRLFVFLFTCNICEAQCFFQRVYDNNQQEHNFSLSIVQSPDDKYTFCGFSDGSDQKIHIIQLNECGDTVWTRLFNVAVPPAGERSENIIEVSDGFVITGSHGGIPLSNGANSYLLKLGVNGDSIWYYDYYIGYNNWAQKNLQANDGGFIVAGYRNDSVVTNVPTFLFKTSNNGILEWSKEYNDTPATSNYLRALDFTKDGGYFLMGQYANQSTQSYDYFLIKSDSAGNQQWKKIYGSPTIDEEPKDGITTLDGGFILTGYSASRTHLIKTDTAGIVEWEKFYADSGVFETAKAIRQLPDSSYIVACGRANPNFSNSYMIRLRKLDKAGGMQWDRFYEYYSGSGKQTYVEDLKITKDKGYIMTGYIINGSLPQKNDAWVLKVDSLGNICYRDSTAFTVWNPGCSQYDCNYIQANITVPDTVYKDSTVAFFGSNSFATQWQWDFGEGNTDTLQNPVHTYGSIGEFTVTLVVSNGSCSDTVMETVVVVNWVGMEELLRENLGLKVYPNPANESITIKCNVKNSKIIFSDIAGRQIKSTFLTENEITIDLSDVEAGIYFASFIYPGKIVVTRKMAVVR